MFRQTKTASLYLSVFLLFFSFNSSAQKESLPKSYLQQTYLINAFIEPQLKKGALKIVREEQLDSVFSLWETGWRKVAADSMANNPTKLSKEDFNNLDAYCYFWGMSSMAQDMDFADKFCSPLISKYMVPSMRRDLEIIKHTNNTELIERLDVANTFAIGSFVSLSKPAFLEAFALYKDFDSVYQDLAKRPDTAISNAAKKQLPTLERMYYAMHARNSYYTGDYDKAFTYMVTGLSVDRYSKSRAIDLMQKLNTEYFKNGEKDKVFALLNTMAINTTADNLNRDTLQTWYKNADAILGPKMYANVKAKLSNSAFKEAGKLTKLPTNWSFLINQIPAEKLKTAKYILVDFWYTGCGPCLAEIPELNAFYEKIKSRNDVILVSINTDYENGKMDRVFVTKRSQELGIHYPVFYDSTVTTLNKQLEIMGYPTKVILSTTGQQFVKTDQSAISLNSFEEFLKEKK